MEKEKLCNEAKALISKDVDSHPLEGVNEARKWVDKCKVYILSVYGENSVEYEKFMQVKFKADTYPLNPNMINQIMLTMLLNGIEQVLVEILKVDISDCKKGKRLVSCSCGFKGKKQKVTQISNVAFAEDTCQQLRDVFEKGKKRETEKKEIINKYKINENNFNKFLYILITDNEKARKEKEQEDWNSVVSMSKKKEELKKVQQNYICKRNKIIYVSLILLALIWLVIIVSNLSLVVGVILTIAIVLLGIYLSYKEQMSYKECKAKYKKDINAVEEKLECMEDNIKDERKNQYREFYNWRCRNYNKDMEKLLQYSQIFIFTTKKNIEEVNEKDIIKICTNPGKIYNDYFAKYIKENENKTT